MYVRLLVRFEWDEAKRAANLAKHGVDFADVPEIFTGPMLIGPDARRNYGEVRQIGFGFIRGRLMVVAFTERQSDTIRIISARKANSREKIFYQETLAHQLGKN
jgi:uncharacterized DUF497 family protein